MENLGIRPWFVGGSVYWNIPRVQAMADPGYVYLLRDVDTRTAGTPSDYLKLGKTKNEPNKRINILQTGNPRLITRNWYFTPEMTKLETFLHHYFSSDRVRGEWFLIDSTRETNEVIPTIETHIEEQTAYLGHCASNELWADVPDNGQARDPTTEEQTLSDELRAAREAKILAQAQHDIHAANLRAAIGTSNGIEDILLLQLKTHTAWKFNKNPFLASLTLEEQEACHDLETKWKSSATFQNKGDNLATLNPTLEAALVAAEALVPSNIPDSNLSNPQMARTSTLETEHQAWLDTKRDIAVQEWIINQRQEELKASIGAYKEITGVMKWQRGNKTTSVFNGDEAKRLFEVRMIGFMTPPPSPTSISVVINETRPYP